MSRPVTDAPLPDWMRTLAEAAAVIPVELVSRFAPPPAGGRAASVLVLFGNDGPCSGPDVLLLQRATTLRSHPGQPAFPGGAADPGDGGPAGTALREAQEEVALEPSSVEVATALPDLWLPASGFVVSPVLGWWREPHEVYAADPAEVASVARVPVAELVDPANRLRVRHPSGYVGPAFTAGDMLVWGFTAGILATLLELGGWARPWDRSRVQELPESAVELAARTRPRDAAGVDRDPDIPPASRDESEGDR
ncbi:MAG TPA: CoA pyrophosphatase [Mycobacteriales bacterium]|nr:CoA pyrophosphatase [Mycobacteriales bacterium]